MNSGVYHTRPSPLPERGVVKEGHGSADIGGSDKNRGENPYEKNRSPLTPRTGGKVTALSP